MLLPSGKSFTPNRSYWPAKSTSSKLRTSREAAPVSDTSEGSFSGGRPCRICITGLQDIYSRHSCSNFKYNFLSGTSLYSSGGHKATQLRMLRSNKRNSLSQGSSCRSAFQATSGERTSRSQQWMQRQPVSGASCRAATAAGLCLECSNWGCGSCAPLPR